MAKGHSSLGEMGKKMRTESGQIPKFDREHEEGGTEPLARTLAVTTYLLMHSAFLQSFCSLTPGQYVLMDLVRCNIATRTMDLAEHLGVTPSAVTIMLSRLEKRGWIQRSESKSDRRVVHVTITEEGQAEMRRVEGALTSIVQQCTQDASEYASLERILRSVQKTLVLHLRTSCPASAAWIPKDEGEL